MPWPLRTPDPRLDSAALQQEMLALRQQASPATWWQRPSTTLKPLALETLVVGRVRPDATHPELR